MSVDQNNVTYRDIPGYPGYRVGDDGSVWSCHKPGGGTRTTWKQLKVNVQLVSRTYKTHAVSLSLNGKLKTMYVHTLVLTAFKCARPEGMQCAHLDGNSANNRLENLEWKTMQENINDKRRHGTTPTGEKNPKVKLTDNQISELISCYKLMIEPERKRASILAARYGLSKSHVRSLLQGRRTGVAPVRTRCKRAKYHDYGLLEHDGVRMTLNSWARRLGVPSSTLYILAARIGAPAALRHAVEISQSDKRI